MLKQQQQPEDYVIVTGEQPSVREFVEAATGEVGIELRREGSGVDEKGYDPGGRYKLAVDLRYFRPTEVETLLGDPSKAREKLDWRPRVGLRELVAEMAREDFKAAARDALVERHGYRPMIIMNRAADPARSEGERRT